MSFSNLFDSEFRNRNKGHFSAIVRVAFADGFISEEEKQFLNKLAINLEISESEYAEILENPLKFPINPPYSHDLRLERLYDLARMVHVDHYLGDAQDIMLKKFGVALGFSSKNVNTIVEQAMNLIDKKVDLDTFVDAMKNSDKN